MGDGDEPHDTVPMPDRGADDTGEMTPITRVGTGITLQVEMGTTARQMAHAFLDSDYPRALALAEKVLSEHPGDVMAEAIAKECRAMRELASSIPIRVATWDDRVDAEADAVAASILSLVDGRSAVREIVELAEASGLGPDEALRRFEELVAQGVLRLVPADEAVL